MTRARLSLAIAAALGCTAANAVRVNPDGLGSVLLYPYYTVRSDNGGLSTRYFDGNLSIVNGTGATKAVKVRFRESLRGAEVLAFNLFLGAHDAWTGAIVRTTTADSNQEGAKVVSTDRSCVVPNTLFAQGGALSRFHNANYAGPINDGGSQSLDRARTGYVEVIEMGEVISTAAIAAATAAPLQAPANCGYFQEHDGDLAAQLAPPTGGLHGALALVNVGGGNEFAYDAVALEQWSPNAVQYTASPAPGPSIAPPGASTTSTVHANGKRITSTWSSPRDAVSAVLMASEVTNDYVIETQTAAATSWILTFPTKDLYVEIGPGPARSPFNANFNNGQSCDPIIPVTYDREGARWNPFVFGLPPPTLTEANLKPCFTVNALGTNGNAFVGPAISANFFEDTPIIAPWAPRAGQLRVRFFGNPIVPLSSTIDGQPAPPQRHFGLPVIGVMVQSFSNGNVGAPPVLSNYGGAFRHRYLRQIEP